MSTPKPKELFLATSLRDGLEDNNIKQVTTLLQSKEADPNVLLPMHGITPFHLVIGNESQEFAEEVTKLFLRHGGDPNVKSVDGMTPVHVAAAWGRVNVLELLLAHGGDPLGLDDEGRSPFHYAFDGCYYEAITVLGKYSAKRQEDDADGDDEPKIEMKLEKILVNKGDVVAEYIPSEIDLSTTTEDSRNSPVQEFQRNITLRRHQMKRISPIPEPLNIEIKERSAAEEKILIGEIINRLSDSFNKAEKEDLNLKEKENIKKKKFRSLLPQPKYFKSNLTPKKEKIFQNLDNSIISTSPNFRIRDFRDEKTPKKIVTPSIKRGGTPGNKSASSTPKRKGFASKFSKEKRNEASPMNKTYNKKEIFNFSPESGEKLKGVNRRLLSRELARKLEKSYDDDDNKIENFWDKKSPQKGKIDFGLLRDFSDKKRGEGDSGINGAGNSGEKPEKKGKPKYFESPGSSNPRSFIESPRRDSNAEELELWREIDQIYEEKGRTPVASVSGIDEDSVETLEATDSGDLTMGTTFESTADFGNATRDSEDLDVFQTPLRSGISSRCSLESFFSVDEEYAYVDSEKNVAFVERRMLVLPTSKMEDMNNVKNESTWMSMLERLSLTSASSVPSSVGGLSTFPHDHHSLRYRLMALGEAPGPITDTTFNVYLKRLRKLEKTVKSRGNPSVPEFIESPEQIQCSKNISRVLLSTDWTTRAEKYREIEHQVFREYETPSGRNYRGGIARVSFNYLLLDPRITNDLPRTGTSLPLSERWTIFLNAIFYIGKGKSARPAAHLYEAFDLWTGKKTCDNPSDKLKTIMEIWRSGKGVVSLPVFSNSMQEEAFNREAAMIDALGTSNLSNCCRGQYYGLISTMCLEEKRLLGKFLLYKAMEILMHEGERQLFPKHVE